MRRIYTGMPSELRDGDRWSYGGTLAPLSAWSIYHQGHAIEQATVVIWIARDELDSTKKEVLDAVEP